MPVDSASPNDSRTISRSRTLLRKRYPQPQFGSVWVLRGSEIWGAWLATIVGIALDNAIK